MPRRLLMPLLAAAALLAPVATAHAATDIVVSEFRARGPAGGNDEFVELRNRSAAPVSIAGYRLAGCASTSGNVSVRTTVPAGVVLDAGQSYLFTNTGTSSAPGYSGTVAGDQTYGSGFSDFESGNRSGILVLDASDTPADGVGSPTSPCREGTGITTPTGPNGDHSFERLGGGTSDTDDNAADFTGPKPGTPQNRNSTGPPADVAPTVSAMDPADGEKGVSPDTTITVTFSEPVTPGPGAFSLSCTDGDAHAFALSTGDGTTYALDPAQPLPQAGCTVLVEADAVTDSDANDPPDAMARDFRATFYVDGVDGLRIHDIQGREHRSPYEGRTVDGVPGIVTAVSGNGFWMQDAEADADRRTSEGIFVFRGGRPAIGTAVSVNGLVEEFRPGGDEENLTTTEISNPVVTPTGTGAIAPTKVGKGGLRPPLRFIDNDSDGDVEQNPLFDPWQDGIDFHESLEGMWVEITRPEVVGPTSNFDELPVVSDGAAKKRTPRGGVIVSRRDFNPERYILDDGMAEPPDANVGDGFSTPVRAVVDYSFGNFKYLLTSSPARVDRGLQREVTDRPGGDELSTGSMNVENLSPANAASKFERLARILVENMRAPDLVAVEEVQDNDGPTNSTITDGSLTWQRFIETIEAEGGPRYEFAEIDPVDDQDGGQPGGNIRVGFLYRTDRGLDFVERPGGTSVNSTEPVGDGDGVRLTYSPGRVEPLDDAWEDSRKPLAGEFRWRGETLIAIANHFSSKGGDQPLFGRYQPPARVTEEQRHRQAAVLRDFVRDALEADRNANVAVLGDLNDFEFSRTLDILESAPLVNLMETLPKRERYSYVFEGNSQTLDQILVTRRLRSGAEYDSVHVNAEFDDQASDHDPQVARLDLGRGRHHADDSGAD